jgi:hypothetical protein
MAARPPAKTAPKFAPRLLAALPLTFAGPEAVAVAAWEGTGTGMFGVTAGPVVAPRVIGFVGAGPGIVLVAVVTMGIVTEPEVIYVWLLVTIVVEDGQ